jgi:hypothetical protein
LFLLESVRQEKDQREERAKQEEDDKYKVVSIWLYSNRILIFNIKQKFNRVGGMLNKELAKDIERETKAVSSKQRVSRGKPASEAKATRGRGRGGGRGRGHLEKRS